MVAELFFPVPRVIDDGHPAEGCQSPQRWKRLPASPCAVRSTARESVGQTDADVGGVLVAVVVARERATTETNAGAVDTGVPTGGADGTPWAAVAGATGTGATARPEY